MFNFKGLLIDGDKSIGLQRRDAFVAFRLLWAPVLLLVVPFGLATAVEYWPVHQGHWTLGHALHAVIELAVLNPVESYADTPSAWGRALFFFMPLVTFTSGFNLVQTTLLGMLSRKRRTQEWEVATAQVLKDHIIVCGLGASGAEVVQELCRLGLGGRIVAVDLDPLQPGVRAVRELGVPVILGDARRTATLMDAGVLRASQLVLTGDDDDLHIGIYLKANDLRGGDAGLKVVMRCHDPRLFESAEYGGNIVTIDATTTIASEMCKHGAEAVTGDRVPKVAVVGMGKVGASVAKCLPNHPKFATSDITLVDRREQGAWKHGFGPCDTPPNCTPERAELQTFLDGVRAAGYDVVFVATGEDSAYFRCSRATASLSASRAIVRTKYLSTMPGAAVVAVNTTTLTTKAIVKAVGDAVTGARRVPDAAGLA